MKNSRSTAERVRPILAAMERSIETARRRRLHEVETPAQPRPLVAEVRESNDHAQQDLPRRKARPKRPAPLALDGGPEYRARAG